MSNICPKCGKQMEGDICKSCQSGNTKQNNAKKNEDKNGEMNIVSGIFFGFAALLVITLSCWVYGYGSHVHAEMAAERAERKAAKECCEEAFTNYENGSYYESFDLIVNEYNVNHRGVLPEKDAKIDELYTLLEQSIYENAIALNKSAAVEACDAYMERFPDGKYTNEINDWLEKSLYQNAIALTEDAAVEACNAYIERFPDGKYLKKINEWLAENKFPEALSFIKYLDPVKNSDGTYSFKGYIEGGEYDLYSIDRYTICITALNGEPLKTGDAGLLWSLYITNSGGMSTILSDLLDHPAKYRGILFEFVYDTDGDFVELRQNGKSVLELLGKQGIKD